MIIDQQHLQVTELKNQLLPVEGPACIPLILDFTANDSYQLQMQNIQSRAYFSIFQTVWIDASVSSVDVTVSVKGGNQQTIIAKAGTQGYYNILVPNPVDVEFTCAGGPLMQIIMINVPIPGAVWPNIGDPPAPTPPAAPVDSVQFNNAGAFGGSANLTWDGATLRDKLVAHIGVDESEIDPLIRNFVGAAQLYVTGKNAPNSYGIGLEIQATAAETVEGIYAVVLNKGGFAVGIDSEVFTGADGGSSVAAYVQTTAIAGVAANDHIGIWITKPSVQFGASIVTNYGLQIDDQNVATNSWAVKTGLGLVEFGDIVKFSGAQSTAAGAALLGANSPATVLAAPYTWIKAKAADGTDVFIPAWK